MMPINVDRSVTLIINKIIPIKKKNYVKEVSIY